MHNSFSQLVLYFTFYSFLGWICEEFYCSVPAKKIVNWGFLVGPYLPIYGFGALLILLLLRPFTQNVSSIGILFIACVIVTSTLEYLSSLIMEKLFAIRWWDYSHKRFNLNGRVCLQNSILFGLLGVVLVHIINPFVVKTVSNMGEPTTRVIASLLISLFLIDLTTTLNSMFKLEERANKILKFIETLEHYNKDYKWFDRNNIAISVNKLEQICATNKDEQTLKFLEELKQLASKDKISRRLLLAFPRLTHIKLGDSFTTLLESAGEMKEKAEEIKEKVFTKLWHFIKGSYNSTEGTETNTLADDNSFAHGIHFYKLFWVFFIASILGFVVETLFCIYKVGHIESRQGLIYGPFSQIYGIGAVILTILLRKIEKRSDVFIFIYSGFIGGIFEYVTSVLQQTIFGTTSWQYSKQMYGIAGGRTSLLYMMFWGVLGTIFIKLIYPSLSRFIEKIPNRGGKLVSWVLFAIILADVILSSVAVYRWVERDAGKPASNIVETYLDAKYDDDIMKEIYPNMIIHK